MVRVAGRRPVDPGRRGQSFRATVTTTRSPSSSNRTTAVSPPNVFKSFPVALASVGPGGCRGSSTPPWTLHRHDRPSADSAYAPPSGHPGRDPYTRATRPSSAASTAPPALSFHPRATLATASRPSVQAARLASAQPRSNPGRTAFQFSGRIRNTACPGSLFAGRAPADWAAAMSYRMNGRVTTYSPSPIRPQYTRHFSPNRFTVTTRIVCPPARVVL